MASIESASPRLTFSGLASGLDTGSVVEALIEFERRPLQLLESRKADLQTSQTLLRSLQTMLLRLRDAARAIDNLTASQSGPSAEEELLAWQARSSDESVIEVEAGSSAQAGSHSVRVDALAQVARRVSTAFSDADAALAATDATFTIDFGGDAPIALQVAAGTTLSELRDQINLDPANDGSVQADILFDGSGYRLTVSGTQTGASHDVSVTTDLTAEGGGAFLDAALGQDASDAELVYLGIPVTRESNDVTDLVAGVTLRLRGSHDAGDPAAVAEIEVFRDDEAIAERLSALVDAYNAVRDFSLRQSQVDPSSQRGGMLSGDAFVRDLERTLQLTLGGLYSFAGNSLGSLGQIGIEFDAKGKLVLDEEQLHAALDEDPLAVRELLSGDGASDGVAAALARALEPVVRSGDGSLSLRDTSFDDRIEDLDRQIERFERRLEKREETLLLQFSRLESLISSLKGQASFLERLTTGSRNE
jgi:flagellar hook-associated protein 2